MFAQADSARPQRIAHLVVTIDPRRLNGSGEGPASGRLEALYDGVKQAGGRVPGDRRTPPDQIADDAPLTVDAATAAELATWSERLGIRR